MQSEYITTHVVSSNPAHDELYYILHYVIKFVSDLLQVGGFLHVFPFLHDIAELLMKEELNIITWPLSRVT
jgi:hypothetical protein